MKILHIITSLRTGGAEKLMVDLLPRLKAMGNDVELLLFDGTKTPFYNELDRCGIKINSLCIGGNVYNPLNIFKLKKYLKRFDIIHTHNTACQYYTALAKCLFRTKCQLITTEHNTTNRRRSIFGFKHIDRFIYRCYNLIISISQQATDNLISYIGDKFSVLTIENGVDLSKYNNLPHNEIAKESDIIISMVAGFRSQKDQDTLIKALSQLPENYKLWLIGDGDRRKALEELITTLGLDNRVTLWGIRNDIPQLLAKSHIIVLSSHWEGLSLSSIEGMASGRPFIASDVDGLRDVVSEAGILFPHEDYKQLAEEIEQLAEDKNYYNKIAKQCREKAAQYDIAIMAEKYNDIYHDKVY